MLLLAMNTENKIWWVEKYFFFCGRIFAWSNFSLIHMWKDSSNFASPPISVPDSHTRNIKTSYFYIWPVTLHQVVTNFVYM
jgi:hypothetical protein